MTWAELARRPRSAGSPTGGAVVAPWRSAILVFFVALTIRVVHLLQLTSAPFFTHLLGDSRGYDAWAQRLAGGDWAGTGVFYQAPLYPYVIGGFYALLGRDLLFVRLAQAVIGATTCGLVTLAGTRWFGRRAGVLSGLLLAGYAPALFFDALIQKSVLDGLLVGGLLLALGSLPRKSPTVHWMLTGGLLGLLALNRENAIVLLPVVVLWVWMRAERRTAAVLVTAVGTTLVLAPSAIRNLSVGGELHLTTSQLGPNFYIGNNAAASGVYVPLHPDRGSFEYERLDATEMAEAAEGRPLRPSEVSNYWLRQGWDWIRAHPGAWVRLTGRKLMLLVNATEAADTEDLATHAEWSVLLRVSALLLHFGILAPLGVLGVWITRSRWRELWPLHATCCVLALAVLGFFVLDRYRYPLVPAIVLFAGAGLGQAFRHWKDHDAGERAKTVLLVGIALVVCNWPLLSSTDMRALTHFNIGAALHDDRLDGQAEAEYRAALGLQPTLAVAHTNLGALLTARGDQAGALVHCLEAVRLDPGSPAANVNLGVVLASTGRSEEAVQAFARGLALDPRNADAHYNLARVLTSLGRIELAIDHFRETIRLQPSRSAAYNNLGVLLCSEGRLGEGIEHLRAAVRLDPDSGEAAANLEHALQLARGSR